LLRRIGIKKLIVFFLFSIIFSINLYSRITIKKANRVNKILSNLQQKKISGKRIIIKDDEFNSYFQYFNKVVFSPEVKFVRVKFYENLIKMRLIYQFNKKNTISLLKFFGDSTVEVKGDFSIENIKKGCFKVNIIKLYLNDAPVNNKIVRVLLQSLGQEYLSYSDGYCPNYNINKIIVKKGEILLITY